MKKKSGFSKIMGAKGAGTVVTAFIGLIIIYIAFGILNPKVFTLLNIQNLLRSMSKYLLIVFDILLKITSQNFFVLRWQ